MPFILLVPGNSNLGCYFPYCYFRGDDQIKVPNQNETRRVTPSYRSTLDIHSIKFNCAHANRLQGNGFGGKRATELKFHFNIRPQVRPPRRPAQGSFSSGRRPPPNSNNAHRTRRPIRRTARQVSIPGQVALPGSCSLAFEVANHRRLVACKQALD